MLKRFQQHSLLIFSALIFLALGSYTFVALAAGNTILWSNTVTSTWQTSTNWTGGVTPDATDVAQFGVNPTGSSTVGIDMGAATNNGASNQAVGAIETTLARTANIVINNNSAAVDGTLTLNGATVNGVPNTVIRNGTNVANSRNLTLGNGGTRLMDLALANATDNIVALDSGGNITLSSVIKESGGARRLTITGIGPGRVDITGVANTFTGGFFAKGAEVRVTSDLSLGPVPSVAADNITVDGGRFGIVSGGLVTLDPNRNIVLGSTAGTSISAPGAGGVLTYNGVFKDLTTGGILVKQGAGTLIVGGVSTYTGNTSVNNGTVRLNVGTNRLPAGTTLNLGQAASTNLGTFDLNGFDQQVAGLNSTLGNNVTVGLKNIVTSATAATLTIGGSGSYNYGDSSNIANPGTISGAISILKTGGGTQTFGDANTYTGSTTVNGGILLATNTTGSATGSGAVTINSGGTLGGTGTLSGPVTVASGGIVAPGVGTSGTLGTGALTLNAGAVLNFDLGTASDLVKVTGDLTLSGVLNINAVPGFAIGRYVLFTYTGNLTNNTLTLGTVPAFTFVIDTSVAGQVAVITVPTVVSINRDTPLQQDTHANSVIFRVTFSTDVANVDTTDFAVTTISGTVVTLNVTNVTPVSNSVYTVTVDTGTGSGEIRLDLIDNDSITDANTTPLGGTGTGNGSFTAGQTYRVDHAPLTVAINQAAGQADPTRVNSIQFTAVFNKAVSDFTPAAVTLGGTATGGTVSVLNSGDSQTYTVTVAGMPADGSADGTVIVTISASQAHDVAGNGNQASTSTDNQVKYDATSPVVLNVSSTTNNGIYGNGAVIHIAVKLSETVLIVGTPKLALATGAAPSMVNCIGGGGTDTLLFDYTVAPGDNAALLDYANAGALTLNGGSIADAAGNSAALALPTPGAAGSLGANKNLIIDTTPNLAGVSPTFGPTAGGTSVTISGGNLIQATVKFGTIAVTVTSGTDSQIVITAPPHSSGPVDILVTVPGGMATLANAFFYDDPPVVGAPLVVSGSPLAGRPVSVTVSASDPDNTALLVTFDWGDGSPLDTNNSHVYASPGMYLVTVTVSDGKNIVTTTIAITVASTVPMKVTKLSGRFKTGKPDTVTVTAVINGLPAGFVFDQKTIGLNIGGAMQNFTLGPKAKAAVGKSSVTIKGKLKKNMSGQMTLVSGSISVVAKLTGSFIGSWGTDGIDPTKNATKQIIHMTVDCVFNGNTYTDDISPVLTDKANTSGKFTFKHK